MEFRMLEKAEKMPWSSYMQTDHSLAIGGFEKGELQAFAVFSKGNPMQQSYMILDYIYVAESAREKYMASELLEYMESKFREKGYRAVRTRVCEENQNTEAIHNLLLGEDYALLKQEAAIWKGSARQFYEAPHIQEIIKKKINRAGIALILKKNDGKYMNFMAEMRKRGVELKDLDFDVENSVFFKDACGNIRGCMLVKTYQKEIELRYVYLDERLKKQHELLTMLKAVLQNLEPYNKWQHVKIYIQGKNYIELFSYLLDDFGKRYNVWDYEKLL